MTDEKVNKWIIQSFERELGTDPDTGEGANVQLISWRWETCPFNGKSIHIVATAWGSPEHIMARYWNGEWMIAGDHRLGLDADGKRL